MVGVSTLGTFQAQSLRISGLQQQLDQLSLQLSSGKISDDFVGLGNDVIRSQRARADLNEITIFQRNIDLGTLRLDLQSNSLQNIEDQGELVLDTINLEIKEGQVDLDRIKDVADTAIDIIRDLLNERQDDAFLFTGSDTLNQPINNSGSLETAIGSLLNDWQNEVLTTDELLAALGERDNSANPLAVTDVQVGYSTTLNEAKGVSVRADTTIEVDTTVKADENQFRDLLVALEAIRQLPQEADGNGIDFDLVPDAKQNTPVVINSNSDLGTDIFAVGPLLAAGGQGAGPYEIQIEYNDPVTGPQAFVIDLDNLDGTPGNTPDTAGVVNLVNNGATAAGLPTPEGFNILASVDANGRLQIESDFDITINGSTTGPTTPVPTGTLQFLGLNQDGGAIDVAAFESTTGDPSTTLDEQSEFFQLLESLAQTLQSSLEGVTRSRLKVQDATATINRVGENIGEERSALLSLIEQVEDVDLNQTAVELQQVQFQLQASFQITSSLSQLSLTNFLSF